MEDLNFEVLINKENILADDYVPFNLVTTDNNENNFHQYADSTLKPMVRGDIIPDLQEMLIAAKNAGYSIIVDSGYRPYEYQKRIFEKNIREKGLDYAMKYVAVPGTSEHQTGLCFDIAYLYDGNYNDDIKGEDAEVKWLMDNSYKYGFILRYPEGKEEITGYNYEPWHFRYVGKTLALILHETGETLEEYYVRINENATTMSKKR